MEIQNCLVGWVLLLFGLIQSSGAKDTEHTTLHDLKIECLDKVKDVRFEGTGDYLPEFLDNPDRRYLCQRAWGHGPTGKPLEPVQTDKTQYVTLYDTNHKIPIYSAFIAEPWIEDGKTNDWYDSNRRQIIIKDGKPKTYERSASWKDHDNINKCPKDMPLFSTSDHYKGWDTIDRGHLFPVQFTKDWIENKATNKITNTIPQDKTFNEHQWRIAESHLKEIAIWECQANKKGTPFIITGSVPDYYGTDTTGQLKKKKEAFKIGCAIDPLFLQCPRDKMLITVPTHMWTTMRCIKGKAKQTLFQVSFIGSNYKDGKVIWYEKFSAFEKDLKAMLKVTSTCPIIRTLPHQTASTKVLKEIKKENKNNKQEFHTSDTGYPGWKNFDLHTVRANEIKYRFEREHHHLGVNVKKVSATGSKKITKKKIIAKKDKSVASKKVKTKSKRIKRDVGNVEDTNKLLFLLELDDLDPDADIEVSKIQLTESYQSEEEHLTLDLKRKQIIVEGNNKNGNKFSASVWNDGEETELIESKSTNRVIRIELKPREL